MVNSLHRRFYLHPKSKLSAMKSLVTSNSWEVLVENVYKQDFEKQTSESALYVHYGTQ